MRACEVAGGHRCEGNHGKVSTGTERRQAGGQEEKAALLFSFGLWGTTADFHLLRELLQNWLRSRIPSGLHWLQGSGLKC